ncbi:LytR C-terminal domain-containing protein [Streptomyces sp. NPDC056730]|uniref:LytR C-terminal domain-containing protein n=1 Tax=Streptomyces sp. NPDC056730 TaxID=3345929 RepID=UPI003675AD62
MFAALAKDDEVDKEKLEADAKNPVYAHTVRVQVLNGSGSTGRAATVAESLRSAGFTVVGVGNAPEVTKKTTVGYPQDQAGPAEVLASRLPGSVARQDAEAAPGVVTLTVGKDFDAVR